jgi:uncharacterized protein DUF3604
MVTRRSHKRVACIILFLVTATVAVAVAVAVAEDSDTVILFGDLHSHSANSLDAALVHLPVVGGTGFRGPDMSCEFARHCADLDFWSINDHVEQQTIEQWRENIKAVRECEAEYGASEDRHPMTSFLGWEWTQVSEIPVETFGHRNVVLKELDPVPPRPIAAPTKFADQDPSTFRLLTLAFSIVDPRHAAMYGQILETVLANKRQPYCDRSINTRDLPPDCREVAESPVELAEKLAAWDLDALVIPHGTTWGSFHVPLANWQDLVEHGMHVPANGSLVEISSGHGNSEQYRSWRHTVLDDNGNPICPESTPNFEPCCWRAGEIVRSRSWSCKRNPDGDACRRAVEKARQAYVDAGLTGPRTIRASAEQWRGCGECLDCDQPANLHRPLESVQAALAAGTFDDLDRPWAYPFGFIGSTDSHRAGPGAGYKEFPAMSDVYGPKNAAAAPLVRFAGSIVTPDFERQQSYLYAGSLAAVHARERSRDAIWEALVNRRTYATTGDRILLWFDIQTPDGPLPMGSEITTHSAPVFRVRAVGAPKQAYGCPERVEEKMSQAFIDSVCFGQCFHPTTERYKIERIELVKITPRVAPEEPLEAMIHDPLNTYTCEPVGMECTATFTDPSFVEGGRAAAYYVRVYQEPTPQFNAGNLRCIEGPSGPCEMTLPCTAGFDEGEDQCMIDSPEIAWSSPIFVRP